MTTTTKAGGAVLPVVAWRCTQSVPDNGTRLDCVSSNPAYVAMHSTYNWHGLTPQAAAQATIDELRAEVERLRAVEFNSAVQFRDAVQPLREEVERLKRERDEALADAKEIRARWNDAENEFAALKAKQIDVDAVMRLADEMVKAKCQEQHANRFGSLADWARFGREHDAAREALRAELTKDRK